MTKFAPVFAVLLIAGTASAGAVTTCHTDMDLRGSAALEAARQQCRPGDIVTLRNGEPECVGNRCTSLDLVAEACDGRFPVIRGRYGLVTCTLKPACR